MTVKECYEEMEADYADVTTRIPNDQLIYKYNVKFSKNTEYGQLLSSLEAKDYSTAFRSAHNLKGNCLNLGFSALFQAISPLCDALRNGNAPENLDELMSKVSEKYNLILKTINLMELS